MCDALYSFNWWPQTPYIHADNTSNNAAVASGGIVFEIFQRSFSTCCNRPVNADYQQFTNQENLMESQLFENSVAMPISTSSYAASHAPPTFIRVMNHKGLSLLTHPIVVANNVLIIGISSVWPLLATVLVLTGYAACGFWLSAFTSKHGGKRTEPHRPVRLSFFDAYWFAFVSATTVGYGDKVPSSRVGKLFAMLWILCGICAVSTFTAAITTLLTDQQNSIMQSIDIRDNEIAVINGTIDRHLVLEAGGYPIAANTFEELRDLLHNRSVCAVAADPHYLTMHDNLFDDDFRILSSTTKEVTIGYNFNSANESLLLCLKNEAFRRQLEVDFLLIEHCGKWNHRGQDKAVDVTLAMMFRDVDQMSLLILVAVLVVICFVITLFDYLRSRRRFASESKSFNCVDAENSHETRELATHGNFGENET